MECQIWWARPELATADHERWFSEAERIRAAGFLRSVDRDRFTVGCAVSRLVLAGLLGTSAEQVPLRRECLDCGGPHGRPRLEHGRWHVSVSHSGDHVVVAFSDAGPVGVDVQRIDPRMQTADAVLTRAEAATLNRLRAGRRAFGFIRYWVRKEAVLKAIGTGLRRSPTSIQVTGPDEDPVVTSGIDGIALADLGVDDRHAAAVALMAPRVPLLTHHRADQLLAGNGRSNVADSREGTAVMRAGEHGAPARTETRSEM